MNNNILFTCVGKKAHLIKQFCASIKSNLLDLKCIAIDSSKYAAALYFADEFFISPKANEKSYKDFILEICKKKSIGLIIPFTDYDIILLSENKEFFLKNNISVMVPDNNNILKYRNKFITAKIFNENNIQIPKTYSIHDITKCKKIISKPIAGSGSQGLSILTKENFNKSISNNKNLIIQEFIDGYEITCDLLVEDFKMVVASQRKRLKVRDGEVMNAKMINHSTVLDSLGRMPGAFSMEDGIYTIQCMVKDNIPYFTEINPRVGGGIPLTIHSGLDLPMAVIQKFILKEKINISTKKKLIEMIRWDEAVFI